MDLGNIKVTVSAEDNKCSAVSSNFLEDSQNLLSRGEREVNKGEVNMSFSDLDSQCVVTARKNFLQTCGWRLNVQKAHSRSKTQSLCASASPANIQGDSLGAIVSNVSVPSFSWFKSMSQIFGLTATWQQDKVEGNPTGANTASNAKPNSNPVHTEFNFFL